MQLVSAQLSTLLLLSLVFPGQSQINFSSFDALELSPFCLKEQEKLKELTNFQNELVRSMPGSVDKEGICHCVVHLPNNSILLQQLEQLQSKVQEITSKYELSRLNGYGYDTEYQDNVVLEMNYAIEPRNSAALDSSYKVPAFNLLHQELEEARELITQIQSNGEISETGDLIHQLHSQVANASFTLKLLMDSDQLNLKALRKEVDMLENQLSECKREKEEEEDSKQPGPLLYSDSCTHGGLQKVSKPHVVQLNWRGFSYKAGTWGRDSAPNPTSSLFWVAPLRADERCFDYYRSYNSYDDLVLLKNYKERKMSYGDGSGNTVYQNFMYFNYYGTGDMAKVDLSTNKLVLRRPLPGATYNNRFSYAGVNYKDIDFSGDEEGLWVLYSTEERKGNLVVSRLNASSLEVEQTWHTSQYKPTMSGAFMACGVLYALRSLSTRQEEIFYAFDTTTGQECHLSILLDKMLEKLQGINYCPTDHKLYVYNDGFLINYDLNFLTAKCTLPRASVKKPGTEAPQKSVKPKMPSRV